MRVDDVLPRYQANVTNGITKSAEFANTLGFNFWNDQVTIYMIAGLDNLYQSYAERTRFSIETARQHWGDGSSVAISGPGWLFVNANAPWWENQATDQEQEKVASHEFFHLIHHDISQLSLSASNDRVPLAGPRWLSEGTAEWFGWWVATLDGSVSYQNARDNRIAAVTSTSPGTLDSMETWTGFNVPGGYDLGMLVGEFLAQGKPEKIVEYYGSLQRGTPWQETFEQIFGQSIEAFYQSWEAHREAGFPTR
ncbi:MAG: hypothetical protein IID01_10510 [Chloroflexi bacterium]|nr:hypothetical protein [Chloroflexota bacterium]